MPNQATSSDFPAAAPTAPSAALDGATEQPPANEAAVADALLEPGPVPVDVPAESAEPAAVEAERPPPGVLYIPDFEMPMLKFLAKYPSTGVDGPTIAQRMHSSRSEVYSAVNGLIAKACVRKVGQNYQITPSGLRQLAIRGLA